MQYRQFGQLDWRSSALGFGIMRLPTVNDESGNIDEDRAIDMVRYAIDQGLNYIDTAWPYHDGNSEEFVAKVLDDGNRDQVRVATKLPSWDVEEPKDMDEYLDNQLARLNLDQIDFYLLHALNHKYWEKYKQFGVFEWLNKIQSQGKIAHAGFSFHDDLELFKEIVDSYDWSLCQIQYNYLDRDFQAGRQGLKYAYSQGLAVIIMEPLRGGKLAVKPPPEIQQLWNRVNEERSPVSWALNWLWNQPEISVVLSGMSTMEQVEENVQLAKESRIGQLSDEEVAVMEKAAAKYRKLSPVRCTGCNYCMPCPNGVHIPTNFQLYNDAEVYHRFKDNKQTYEDVLDEEQRASACVACGQCEEVCPQQLEIIDLLAETARYFESR
ncbi:MAG: aldo/keto reductase [Candidatus Bipolaricaulota bacterium]